MAVGLSALSPSLSAVTAVGDVATRGSTAVAGGFDLSERERERERERPRDCGGERERECSLVDGYVKELELIFLLECGTA